MLNQKAADWMEARRIEAETAARFGIESYTKTGMDWLKIPYIRNGKAVNHKHRCIDEKRFFQDEGAEKAFWNEDVIFDQSLKDQPLIITEGEFDALAAIQAGFPKAVSVPDGAPASPIQGDTTKYEYLDRLATAIRENCPFVIIAADGDQAGANLLHDLSLRLGRDVCKWIKYPKDCKDLNEALLKYGPKGVTETINRAQWLKLDGVYKASELPPLPERKVFRTINGLGEHYRLRLGDFTVVTGIPGHGKSTFVNDLCATMAENNGLKTAFASFEQHPSVDHIRNLRRWKSRRKYPSPKEIEKADEWIESHFVFIYPTDRQHDEEDIDLPWLLEKAAASVTRHGANIVVVDPWNEMDHTRPNGMSMTDYVSRAIKQFKQFARAYNVHLIIVAHPTKLAKNKDGKLPVPSLYDISDSAHWANKADIGIVIHKEDFDTSITVAKSRYHEILGRPGTTKYHFNSEINRFECAEVA